MFRYSEIEKFINDLMALLSKSILNTLLAACLFLQPFQFFAQINSISIEPIFFHSTSTGSSDIIPEGAVTYHIYANFDNQTDFLSSVFGNEACTLQISSTEPFFQSSLGGHTADLINPALFEQFPELQYDSFVTIGKTNSNDPGGQLFTLEDPDNPWIAPFESGNDLIIDSYVGGLWFVFNEASSTNAVAGIDLRVLIAQVTTTGLVTGQAQGQVFLAGDPTNALIGGCFDFDIFEIPGCVDDTACNYDASAAIDDGSCIYQFNVTVLATDVSCYEAFDGAIELSIDDAQGEIGIVWSNGDTNLTISNLAAGEYSYAIVDDGGCEASGEVVINEPEPITVLETIVHPPCGNSADGSIQLESEADMIYSWLGEISNESSSFITNLQGGAYSVIVEDANGCLAQIEFTLIPLEESCLRIPTGFTPNNDGYNDVWEIVGVDEFPEIRVSVFNRWGQELYNSIGHEDPWDGTHNGIQLPMASYYYVITLAPGETPLTGHVTIKY